MPEGRMAEIVSRARSVNKAEAREVGRRRAVWINFRELPRNATGDLSHLKAVGQAGPVEVAVAKGQDLRLAL